MAMLTAILQREEDTYVASCPEVGTVSQGSTIEEAVANLKEATQLFLEETQNVTFRHPIIKSFEVGDYVNT